MAILVKDAKGNTALHTAALLGHLDKMARKYLTTELLMEKNLAGISPLQRAIDADHLDQLLVVDLDGTTALQEIVGAEWWKKHLTLINSKLDIMSQGEEAEVWLF